MIIKRFLLCLVLFCFFVGGRAQAAPAQVEVTRDNFVSLTWSVASRVDEKRTLDYFIDKNSISLLPIQFGGGFGGGGGFAGGFPPYSPPIVKPLSTNQFEALVRALKLATAPAIASEPAKDADSRENLVLTLSDANNADQSFVISQPAKNSPVAPRELNEYLAALVRGKGLAEAVPAAQADAGK